MLTTETAPMDTSDNARQRLDTAGNFAAVEDPQQELARLRALVASQEQERLQRQQQQGAASASADGAVNAAAIPVPQDPAGATTAPGQSAPARDADARPPVNEQPVYGKGKWKGGKGGGKSKPERVTPMHAQPTASQADQIASLSRNLTAQQRILGEIASVQLPFITVLSTETDRDNQARFQREVQALKSFESGSRRIRTAIVAASAQTLKKTVVTSTGVLTLGELAAEIKSALNDKGYADDCYRLFWGTNASTEAAKAQLREIQNLMWVKFQEHTGYEPSLQVSFPSKRDSSWSILWSDEVVVSAQANDAEAMVKIRIAEGCVANPQQVVAECDALPLKFFTCVYEEGQPSFFGHKSRT